MAWIEMSRDVVHGGGDWGFGSCLWSPTRKQTGGKWAYWEALLAVQPGDLVVHLRGSQRDAKFVGMSFADSPAFTTTDRPPEPGQWAQAKQFFRILLRDYEPFAEPPLLKAIFRAKSDELRAYHGRHSPLSAPNGKLLFFVPQAGDLQCQNGAYLTELDHELAQILFENEIGDVTRNVRPVGSEAAVADQFRTVLVRVGQQEFSDNVTRNYNGNCCFPECPVNDRSFLIGSHIARWADSPKRRGMTSNGLALCLAHDRAFERGLFTLDANYRIRLCSDKLAARPWASRYLANSEGQSIRMGQIPPDKSAIEEHWKRIQFSPK